MGMQDRLGVMVIATQRLMRLAHANNFKEISFLKVSENREMLFVGALNCRLYCIPIVDITKTIVEHTKSCQFNNLFEFPGNCITHEFTLTAPISTFYVIEESTLSTFPRIVVGHHTGELSIISGTSVERRVTCISEPIT